MADDIGILSNRLHQKMPHTGIAPESGQREDNQMTLFLGMVSKDTNPRFRARSHWVKETMYSIADESCDIFNYDVTNNQ